MFKVKATVVSFAGEEEKYPCHFGYKIGDEFAFDGEKFIGKICQHTLSVIIPKMVPLIYAGPRYIPPDYYLPFWYSPISSSDSSLKKYDGLGFKPIKETIVEPPGHLARLQPEGSFMYPPPEGRSVARDTMVICPDTRTSVVFKLEAFDLSDHGESVPYFRKEMMILKAVLENPGIRVDEIRDKLSEMQREEIYPLAALPLMKTLTEEHELMAYLENKEGQANITEKGKTKLEEFKNNLTEEERKALSL